jgi:hypothetical protein
MADKKRKEPSSKSHQAQQQTQQTQQAQQQAELNETEIKLVQWEEWALSTEEHFHAEDLHARMPGGPAMGHIHR